MKETWQEFLIMLPEIEARIRDMLFWDVGDSRLLLWLSAIVTFMLIVTPASMAIGYLVGKLFPSGPIGPR